MLPTNPSGFSLSALWDSAIKYTGNLLTASLDDLPNLLLNEKNTLALEARQAIRTECESTMAKIKKEPGSANNNEASHEEVSKASIERCDRGLLAGFGRNKVNQEIFKVFFPKLIKALLEFKTLSADAQKTVGTQVRIEGNSTDNLSFFLEVREEAQGLALIVGNRERGSGASLKK